MIIDFHTHVFPDKIAKRTIELLEAKGGIPSFSDGSTAGLISRMEEATVDLAISLPVLTSPEQFESVNRFALSLNEKFADKKRRIISFAGIHPLCEQIDEKMAWIRKSGFLGVKIHPDYQQTFINDPSYVRILECAKEEDLIVITHSGIDVGYKDCPVRCTPELVAGVIDKVKHKKLVLAHAGACNMIDGVFERLCEKDVYFDTAYILRFIGEENFKKLIKLHGDERILFASDSPWSSIADDVQTVKSFKLDKETEEKIFYKNALKLLGI